MKVPLSWLENYVQLPPLDELLPRAQTLLHLQVRAVMTLDFKEAGRLAHGR